MIKIDEDIEETVYFIEMNLTWLTDLDTVADKNISGWTISRVHTSPTPVILALSDSLSTMYRAATCLSGMYQTCLRAQVAGTCLVHTSQTPMLMALSD